MSTRILMAVLSVTAMLACPALAESVVTANFTDGNGTTTVDAYTGMSGGGWLTAWQENLYHTANLTNTVTNTNPVVTGGGNYLSASIDATQTDVRFATGRDYSDLANGGMDTTKPVRIQFTYRIDENLGTGTTFANYMDRFVLFGGVSGQNVSGVNDSWEIYGVAAENLPNVPASIVKQWAFYDGNNDGSYNAAGYTDMASGIPLATGGLYQFTIEVFPESAVGADDMSWNGAITYLNPPEGYTGITEFSRTDLGWRRNAATPVPSYVYFSTRSDGLDDTRAFSVDGITVSQIPEPGTVVLLIVGLGLLAIHRVRG